MNCVSRQPIVRNGEMSNSARRRERLVTQSHVCEVRPATEYLGRQQSADERQDPFVEQQIRALIQQVFFPAGRQTSAQVVFCAVDELTDAADVCVEVAKTMSTALPGAVCLVEASVGLHALEAGLGLRREWDDSAAGLRERDKDGERVAENLWLVRRDCLTADNPEPPSPAWLRTRLNELRRQFDYSVVHAPAVGTSNEAALLGQFSDGVVLVLDANRTRRVVARKAIELLQAANAKILGTVLNQRTFPIPEPIYRKL